MNDTKAIMAERRQTAAELRRIVEAIRIRWQGGPDELTAGDVNHTARYPSVETGDGIRAMRMQLIVKCGMGETESYRMAKRLFDEPTFAAFMERHRAEARFATVLSGMKRPTSPRRVELVIELPREVGP